MCEPFVTDSRSRRNETSCDARPGAEGDEALICDTRIDRPVRVARTSRWMRCLEPVNLSGGGVCVAAILPSFFTKTESFSCHCRLICAMRSDQEFKGVPKPGKVVLRCGGGSIDVQRSRKFRAIWCATKSNWHTYLFCTRLYRRCNTQNKA